MSKFEIKFFNLTPNHHNGRYLEEIFDYYGLILSSLKDVKSFLTSDFYNNVFEDIGGIGDGIIITENKKVIYKKIHDGLFETKFLIFKDSDDKIFYILQLTTDIEDKDLVIVDKYNIAGHGYCFEEEDFKEEIVGV